VVLDRGDGLQARRLAWGLLPFWAKAKGLPSSTINARMETVATKPAFRSAFKAGRCLIPMAGYYEWSVSPADGQKDPWFTHAATPLRAAGLWEDSSKLLGEDNVGTVTVITGDSSGISADIHDRMPISLAPCQAEEWMSANADGASHATGQRTAPDGGVPREPSGKHTAQQHEHAAATGSRSLSQCASMPPR
jgi:putative SOS response-associated peptidase YedK